MLSKYNYFLNNYPIMTKSASSGFLFGLGDFLIQVVFDRKKHEENQENKDKNIKWEYNYRRTNNMILIGVCFAGPVLHAWYSFGLPRLVNKMEKTTKFQDCYYIGKGIFIDQTIFASFFLSNFFILNDKLSGKSNEEAVENLKDKFMDTMITNWQIWPFLQIINQGVLPIQHRVLFVNFCGLFWNMYLSYVTYSKKK